MEPETAAVGVAAVFSYRRSDGAARVMFAAAGSLSSLVFFFSTSLSLQTPRLLTLLGSSCA